MKAIECGFLGKTHPLKSLIAHESAKEKKQMGADYMDLEGAITASEDEIKKCKTIIALSEIGLEAFKKALEKTKKPKFDSIAG